MSIHPDIKKAIEIIDQRIEALRQIRESLAKEFGMEEMIKPSLAAIASPPHETPLLPLNGDDRKKTRKQMIVGYLSRVGSASRKQIAEEVGIPNGTVSYVLNDKDTFVTIGHGKWGLIRKEYTA